MRVADPASKRAEAGTTAMRKGSAEARNFTSTRCVPACSRNLWWAISGVARRRSSLRSTLTPSTNTSSVPPLSARTSHSPVAAIVAWPAA
jgi:hypothetical protein